MSNPASLKVSSQVVQEGKPIPMAAVFSGAGGQNVSPDLAWDAPPSGTKSLAVTCYDPDAPTTVGFTHWVLFNLPPDLKGLSAGAGAAGKAPKGGTPSGPGTSGGDGERASIGDEGRLASHVRRKRHVQSRVSQGQQPGRPGRKAHPDERRV